MTLLPTGPSCLYDGHLTGSLGSRGFGRRSALDRRASTNRRPSISSTALSFDPDSRTLALALAFPPSARLLALCYRLSGTGTEKSCLTHPRGHDTPVTPKLHDRSPPSISSTRFPDITRTYLFLLSCISSLSHVACTAMLSLLSLENTAFTII